MTPGYLSTYFKTAVKWILLILLAGFAAGVLSAIFLSSLNWATNYREQHTWLIYFLPLAGLAIGLLYHYTGKEVERGNNLVLDSIHNPKEIIPFKMAPWVLIGTVITHLFGGSAGREGTALQMSAAAADQLSNPFKLSREDRTILLIAGLSAGFSSVFGTPLAGTLFGLEVLLIGRLPLKAIVPAAAAAFLADYVTRSFNVGHTHYSIALFPNFSLQYVFWSILAGIAFSLAAIAFVRLTHWFSSIAKKIPYPPLRPFAGGIIVLVVVLSIGTFKYVGLGIPTILDAFQQASAPQDFAFKIMLTAITLGAGFKGGEVTPLFFVGATLGSALSLFFPLPVSLLAGMGFVAVFSGATKTPLACSIMAVELFGPACFLYVIIACIVSYYLSGSLSIYNAAENKAPKHFLFGKAIW